MRLLFGSCFTFLIAAIIGLGATWFTLTRGVAFGSLTVGAWTAWPKSGSVDIDPYARAGIARSGELPTGMGDGVAFFAHTDDRGDNFDGRCTFTISGMTPAARYWTLTLYDREGRLVANTIDRHGFTSEEIVRDSDGHFAITVAPLARLDYVEFFDPETLQPVRLAGRGTHMALAVYFGGTRLIDNARL